MNRNVTTMRRSAISILKDFFSIVSNSVNAILAIVLLEDANVISQSAIGVMFMSI
jgi:hypothetical protein